MPPKNRGANKKPKTAEEIELAKIKKRERGKMRKNLRNDYFKETMIDVIKQEQLKFDNFKEKKEQLEKDKLEGKMKTDIEHARNAMKNSEHCINKLLNLTK